MGAKRTITLDGRRLRRLVHPELKERLKEVEKLSGMPGALDGAFFRRMGRLLVEYYQRSIRYAAIESGSCVYRWGMQLLVDGIIVVILFPESDSRCSVALYAESGAEPDIAELSAVLGRLTKQLAFRAVEVEAKKRTSTRSPH